MKTVVSAAVYATLIVTFGFQVARVEGQSMVPTLDDQDRLIVNKLAYRLARPQVGDVVMLYYPEDRKNRPSSGSWPKSSTRFAARTARCTATKSSTMVHSGRFPRVQPWGPVVVRGGYYFVMGDHRNNSSDSRSWGDVPSKYIIGKVQVRWWPFNHARVF